MSNKETRKSYGVKETYVSPLNQRITAVMQSLEHFQTPQDIIDTLNKEHILLTSLTVDLQTQFKADIEKILVILCDTPTKATGATTALRTEHALQDLQREAWANLRYSKELWMRITKALDKKGWLDKAMRDIPRNY